jgi:hypothetical protein
MGWAFNATVRPFTHRKRAGTLFIGGGVGPGTGMGGCGKSRSPRGTSHFPRGKSHFPRGKSRSPRGKSRSPRISIPGPLSL